MHNPIFLRAAALSLVLLAASAPAWATRTSTALGICISRGPDCSIANKGDNYEICVNNTDGKQCVSCPNLAQDKQECSVARTDKGTPRPDHRRGRPAGGRVPGFAAQARTSRPQTLRRAALPRTRERTTTRHCMRSAASPGAMRQKS